MICQNHIMSLRICYHTTVLQEAVSLAVVNRLLSHTTITGSPDSLEKMLGFLGPDAAVPLPVGVPFHHPRWRHTGLVDRILSQVTSPMCCCAWTVPAPEGNPPYPAANVMCSCLRMGQLCEVFHVFPCCTPTMVAP